VKAVPDRYACPKCLSVFRSGFPRCPLDGAVLQTLGDEDPLIGFELADRYVIEALIGEGGMGRVYRARHIRMSRRFAIKVLFGDLAADGKARSRFSREAEASSRLSHPNVVSVVDFGETDEGLLYLAMDYIEGQELHRVVAREAPFDAARCLSILRQLARGLAHAHDKGLIHRDFKTENILVTTDGPDEIARIVDFGIAVVGEMTAPEQRLTTEGMVLGTPAYMSPEQSTGEEIDHRADLFSLGVMVYEMLAGKLPFDGTPLAMAKANLAAPVPSIAQRAPGVRADRRLEAVAMRLMAKEPEDRFQTATALLHHLDEVFGRAADTLPPPIAEADAEVPVAVPARTMSDEFFLQADEVERLPADNAIDTREMARSERRRWVIAGAVAIAALLVTGGALLKHYQSAGKERPVAAVDPSPPAVATARRAEPVVQADAGASAAAPAAADAAPAVQVAAREPVATTHKPTQGRHKKEPPAHTIQPVAVMTPADFDRRYREVGRQLDRLAQERGDAAAEALNKKYFDIPYADALRSDSVRKDADRTLRALSSRIGAELKK
jgi:serine/threonine-protein kinase